MPRRTNDFQRLITAIESQLAPMGAMVTESKLIKERGSETEREIDIAIESTVGQHGVLIAIECRDHKRPADIIWIDALIGKYQNLPVEKVVAVSRSGFTRSAVKKANKANITTVKLEHAIDAKLIPSNQPRKLPVDMLITTPPEFNVVLHREDFGKYGEYTGDMKKGKVQSPERNFEGILIDILKSEAIKFRIEEAKMNPAEFREGPKAPITVNFPEGTKIVSDSGAGYRLRRVTIRQSAKIEKIELELNAFRYMDVELLVGNFKAGNQKVHLLLLYKSGAGEYRYWIQTQGDIISTELSFSFGGQETRPRSA